MSARPLFARAAWAERRGAGAVRLLHALQSRGPDRRAPAEPRSAPGISSATRLAVAFAVLGAAAWFVGSVAFSEKLTLLQSAERSAYAGGYFGTLGYFVAGYLRLVSWVGDGFFAERRGRALRHLRFVGVLALVTVAAVFAAVHLRYEVIASGNRGWIQYYLVWDRWTGKVTVKVGWESSPEEVRHWKTAY